MTTIPKRVRYEVLRRDQYTCRYCGARAPDVRLNVDAVMPEALGGSHKDPVNLVTACEACNNGKSSSHPDAPLVAEIADDAVRWAAAMRAASAKMLADIKGRQADRDQFREWWDNWTYAEGEGRQSILLDGDWESTVDQFLAAGLPLPVLKICIDGAMRRKRVGNDHKFRYMCGIAWKKVGELRRIASGITSGGRAESAPGAGVDPYEQGRLDFARELMDEATEGERLYFLNLADLSDWQDEDDDPQTEAQLACSAASHLLNSAMCNVDWLVSRVEETLRALPGDLGEECMSEARDVGAAADPESDRAMRASSALGALVDLIDLPADVAYMESLPEAERAEWIEFAKALYPHAKFGEKRWVARAANCARIAKAGNHWDVMCSTRGEHIPDCPARGAHYAKIAGLRCCEQDDPGDHKGHLVCDRHLEQLVDGTFVGRHGETLVAIDFTEAKEAVPF